MPGLVVLAPALNDGLRLGEAFKEIVAPLSSKLLQKLFSHGEPGSMNAIFAPIRR